MPESTPPVPDHVERILDAAHIAPSYANMQPWRFLVDGETVSFLVDHERDRSPASASGRMARMAVGAALECALLRAGRMGATVRFQTPREGALVTVTLTNPKRIVEPDKALVRRTTNRRLYDGRPLDDATFKWLSEATAPLESTRTHWFGRERVRTLGPIVETGDTLFYGDPGLREATVRSVHFDLRDREEVSHGLSVGSLELAAAERLAFDALRHTPQDRLASTGAFQKMGARARRLVESASGVCVITTHGTEPASDVTAGRCMQRAWLALTRRGLVAQPMMSIPALDAALDALADPEPATAAIASLLAAFPGFEKGARIAVLMRVGWAPPPTSSVRRLPLADSIAVAPPAES
jgi:nitroreductase